ncbi:MAG: hypothetical protein P4L40_24565 [Terracidiphilus sp.]|nr:hypothetical protein [Terracidiphilus sp.]
MKWIVRCKLIGVAGGMLGVLFMVPDVSAGTHKGFPEKYSDVYMPVSLGVGTIRTPEFPAVSRWYDILVQVEEPLPFMQMICMMGVADPLDLKNCSSNDPLLQADWTVRDGEHIVDHVSIPDRPACKFGNKYIYKLLGSFSGEAGKKYTVEVKFTKDGTPLNVANPHLIVIQHRKFW